MAGGYDRGLRMRIRFFPALLSAFVLALTGTGSAQEKGKPPGKDRPAGQAAAPAKPAATTAPPMNTKRILAELSKSPKAEAAEALGERVAGAFGRALLEKGRAKPRIEETVVAWAAIEKNPVVVVRADGTTIGEMTPLGSGGVQALAMELPNFSDFDYSLVAGGKTVGSGHVRVEYYKYTADSFPKKGVPRGKVIRHVWSTSKVFPNTVRDYLIYVPAQYREEEPACLMVWQDGLRHADANGPMRATTVFDNLIHQGEMPVTIGVFIDPGAFKDQEPGSKPANRSFEYDSLGDAYARFLRDEILAEVGEKYNLSDDPACRAIAGGSSGGICAWTASWEMPDQFGKVLCWVGTFVDIRGGHNYPPLIRKTEKKPIRVYLLGGSNDLDNEFGNWPLANQEMAKALEFAGYDYKFHYGECFHGSAHAGAILPEMLRWLWRE